MLSKLFSTKNEDPAIQWKNLTSPEGLEELDEISNKKPVILFKHSTRCGISSMALNRFERAYDPETEIVFYFLDLIQYRALSDEVAVRYGVIHQSPQALLIMDQKVKHCLSHNGIDFKEMNDIATNNNT